MSENLKIYLYIEGFDESPQTFAEKIGVIPDEMTSKNIMNKRNRYPKFNSIKLLSKLDDEEELDKHVKSILERIESLDQFKSALTDSCEVGINTIIYIEEGESSSKCPLFISNETVKKISDLGCNLGFSIYK